MGKNKYKDKMDLIYMLIGLTGIRNNIREQDEVDIGTI
jgi:hypothetical protein